MWKLFNWRESYNNSYKTKKKTIRICLVKCSLFVKINNKSMNLSKIIIIISRWHAFFSPLNVIWLGPPDSIKTPPTFFAKFESFDNLKHRKILKITNRQISHPQWTQSGENTHSHICSQTIIVEPSITWNAFPIRCTLNPIGI